VYLLVNRTMINSPLPFLLVLTFSLSIRTERTSLSIAQDSSTTFILRFSDINLHHLPHFAFSFPITVKHLYIQTILPNSFNFRKMFTQIENPISLADHLRDERFEYIVLYFYMAPLQCCAETLEYFPLPPTNPPHPSTL